MTDEERTRFEFVSRALEDDTFEVVRFRGAEGISRLYEFDITLVSEEPEIDLRAVLRNPATLTIIRDEGDDRLIHGIPAQFEQLQEEGERIFYRAVLVPRLRQADLHRENQLFLDKTVPDIIEEILSQTGLTTDDYELDPTGQYAEWEYICQYSETDFDFMSRWMEREGIYYYFEQTEEFEKLIITDNSSRHEDIAGTSTIDYHPPSSLRAREEEIVRRVTCRHSVLPRRVVLRDYNYRRPDLELRAEADVDTEGRGDVYFYGEHFKTTEEGNSLARIRAQEILCREVVFCGESTAAQLCPGFVFELAGHYRDSYNQRLLITELEHEGSQAGALFGRDERVAEDDSEVAYFNRFVCIPADVQYRPERTTPRPRFFGTMNARVDASGDGQYAEIDDEGRYRVRLYFDQSDRQDGKASRWVRMAQPYSGADYGMHFPLHKGTEVLLTFIDGDLDRPVIAGSVPNPETASPVSSSNQTRSVIRTGGNNQIEIEDSSGGERISFSSPHAKTTYTMGAPNSPGPGHTFETDKHWLVRVGETHTTDAKGDHTTHVRKGNRTVNVFEGDSERNVLAGKEDVWISGDRLTRIGGDNKVTIVGGKEERVLGGKLTRINHDARIEAGLSGVERFHGGTVNDQFIGIRTTAYFSGEFIGGKSWRLELTDDKRWIFGKTTTIDSSVETKVIGGGGRANHSQLSLKGERAQLKCGTSKVKILHNGDIKILSMGDVAIITNNKISFGRVVEVTKSAVRYTKCTIDHPNLRASP